MSVKVVVDVVVNMFVFGFFVEEMVIDIVVELLVGVFMDFVYGYVLMFVVGGILIELM